MESSSLIGWGIPREVSLEGILEWFSLGEFLLLVTFCDSTAEMGSVTVRRRPMDGQTWKLKWLYRCSICVAPHGLKIWIELLTSNDLLLMNVAKNMGPSINDVVFKGEGGGCKNGNLGRFSKLNWGDRGREGGQKTQKLRRRCLWMVQQVAHCIQNHDWFASSPVDGP